MTERQRTLLVLNGAGLLVSAALSGWLHFFQLLGEIDLWPLVNHVDVQVPGESRAWIMAHLEGITNGLLLIAIAVATPFLHLEARQFKTLFYSSLIFGWLFTLPAIANAWFGTRGLAFGAVHSVTASRTTLSTYLAGHRSSLFTLHSAFSAGEPGVT